MSYLSQDYDISLNQLVSQTVYVYTQMVIVEGCPLIVMISNSRPLFKNFLNEGLNVIIIIILYCNQESIPSKVDKSSHDF